MIKKSIIMTLVVFVFCFLSIASTGNTDNHSSNVSGESTAKIVAAPAFGAAPLEVSFDASEFMYHYGDKLSFAWDFNDGRKSDGVTTSHTFDARGTYTVALTVQTPFGPQDAWVVIIVK